MISVVTSGERNTVKDITVAVILLVFVVTMVLDVRVPILSLVDLGIHELGHLLTYPLPDLITAIAGSFAQVAAPLGLAVYFLARKDEAASAMCLGWAATSGYDAARYIADAPYERLELLGGDHDWAYVLFELDMMNIAGTFALIVRLMSWLLLISAAALLASPYVRPALASRVDRP